MKKKKNPKTAAFRRAEKKISGRMAQFGDRGTKQAVLFRARTGEAEKFGINAPKGKYARQPYYRRKLKPGAKPNPNRRSDARIYYRTPLGKADPEFREQLRRTAARNPKYTRQNPRKKRKVRS